MPSQKKFDGFGINIDYLPSIEIGLPGQRELTVGALVGIAGIFMSKFDANLDEEYALESHKFPFSLLTSYGKFGMLYDTRYTFYIVASTMCASFGYSRFTGAGGPAETAGLALKSFVAASALTLILKIVVGRYRPYTNQGPFRIKPFDLSLNSAQMSFPSGHTSSAFALAAVLAKRSESKWFKASIYSFAGSVAFQRMLDRKHWPSDVVVGGVIGYLIGSATVKQYEGNWGRIKISPLVTNNKVGMAISF